MDTDTDPRGVVFGGKIPLNAVSAEGLVVVAITIADDVTSGVLAVMVGDVIPTISLLSLFVITIRATCGVESISCARRFSSITFSE
jgi:hypothetical protein